MRNSLFSGFRSARSGRSMGAWLVAAMAVMACSQVFAWPSRSPGVGSQVEVTVVDRDSGQPAQVYRNKEAFFVAGRPGARYAIKVSNRTGERVLAVMAVDGVNIITGQTGSYDQSGYVLGPWQTQEVNGWRKSNNEVASFVFTALPDSYAARTGRPNDVGVIGVAVFKERQPIQRPQILGRNEAVGRADGKVEAGRAATDSAAPAAATAQAEERLGTGHGERESSYASNTTFTRSTSSPIEVVALRYDSYDNLVRAGIVVPQQIEQPRAFPKEPQQFVPDPPRRY